MMANKALITTFFLSLTIGCCELLFAGNGQNQDYGKGLEHLSLSLEELGKIRITVATGSDTTLEQAPAVASVITAEDIKVLGANDLDQVLQTVPGLHVSYSPVGYTPVYTFRGIRGTQLNPQILMLINNIPITSVFAGDRGIIWGGYPLENIAKIEIIRGPGSALYGAEAYAGIINIITKSNEDIQNVQAGIRAGSFKSMGTWLLGRGSLGGFKSSSYLSLYSTDGQSRTIESDAQSVNDAISQINPFLTPTNASLAPDSVNTGYDSLDGHLDFYNEYWQFRSGINIRENLDSGAGAAQALDPTGENSSLRWTADFTYTPEFSNSFWEPELQVSTMYYREKSSLVLYPSGVNFGTGVFPDGMIGSPEKYERHGRLSLSSLYKGFENHKIRIGGGYTLNDLYKVNDSRNYTFIDGSGNQSIFPIPDLDGNNELFLTPRTRRLKYIFLQDEWSINNQWALTAGVRYDDYSDFGSTTNPRLALVWQTSDTLTTKFLYGEAFRAPAFTELYNENNPVVTGNEQLSPETIRTTEAAVLWQTTPRFSLGANIFQYQMDDIIRYVPNSDPTTGSTAENIGQQTGQGMEIEFALDASSRLRIQGNYSHQTSTDEESHEDAGLAPENIIHIRGDWRLNSLWATNLQVNWVGDRKREPNDSRPLIDDYTIVNLSIRTLPKQNKWHFSLTLHNLFDEDVREPSSGRDTGVLIRDDLPLSGRAIYSRFSYSF